MVSYIFSKLIAIKQEGLTITGCPDKNQALRLLFKKPMN
jgi:hypothetical protein